MSTGTVWNYRDFIKREHGAEEAIEFEIAVKKYQAEQIAYERERILDALHSERKELDQLLIMAKLEGKAQYIELVEVRIIDVENIIALVEGERNSND